MGTPLRVLIIEDSEDDAELTRLELEQAGFDLAWKRVDSEDAFLTALKEGPWDAVISDYQMPAFNGLRAFELYRVASIDAPFIFVSGALGEERAVEAMRVGARDYIVKGNLARLSIALRRELKEAETRKRQMAAEEAAQREQRCLAMAMEATGAGVLEFRLPLRPEMYVTPRWVEILGYELAELPPHDKLLPWFSAMVHPEDIGYVRQAAEQFLNQGVGRFEAEFRAKRKNGTWVDLAVMARAIERNPRGQTTHVVAVMLDLSDRKKLEAQLAQSQKMDAIGRLAGGVAHDFNNLLTVILGYSDLVLSNQKQGPAAREAIEQIHRAATRASDLTRQLLAFSRKQLISPRQLELNKVIEEMSPMIRRIIGEDIDFVARPGANLRKVSADPGQVEQVIMNLVVNARDAMPKGGKLMIEAGNADLDEAYCSQHPDASPGSFVLLAVSDTGTGMEAATMAHIFEPFFTTKERGKGTGLGLATVYGILKQNHGHVSVYSEPGKGTSFKTYWPRSGATLEAPAASRSASATPSGNETVLLVEDEELLRELMAGVLESLGYVVIAACDGVDALEKVARHQVAPDILVTDVVMPRLGGRELAEQLMARHKGLKVLYTSGYTANAIVHHGVLDEKVNFLAKPYLPLELARRVRECLEKP